VKRLWRPPALPGARSCVPAQAAPAWAGIKPTTTSPARRSSTPR
jgi:hypothetical protein